MNFKMVCGSMAAFLFMGLAIAPEKAIASAGGWIEALGKVAEIFNKGEQAALAHSCAPVEAMTRYLEEFEKDTSEFRRQFSADGHFATTSDGKFKKVSEEDEAKRERVIVIYREMMRKYSELQSRAAPLNENLVRYSLCPKNVRSNELALDLARQNLQSTLGSSVRANVIPERVR